MAAKPKRLPWPDVLLVTLDTTRADVVGAWGGAAATPCLDGLARRGVRFASAWSAAPLTLPAHATLLTGREPGEHGLRENGLSALDRRVPLLAEAFADAGYRTAGFVGSRILDRRFGLDRGFAFYDDAMVAERTGEFGYPERSAGAVVMAARDWLAGDAGSSAPRFLWVHLYDPHAPYLPPALPPGAPEQRRYAGEVEAVDRALESLLAALPERDRWLVAVVGDHGEAFGERGERAHGLLLGPATLAVPLLLAGPGVPAGRVIAAPVATRRLAATLLELARVRGRDVPGPALSFDLDQRAEPIVHETFHPASVYGWAPLVAVTRGPVRVVIGPKARVEYLTPAGGAGGEREVGESTDAAIPSEARPLVRVAREYLERHPFALRSPAADVETRALLGSLGYSSGASGRAGTLDPDLGVQLVARFDEAGLRQEAGDLSGALAILRELVAASPDSVPFLARAAALERAAGSPERAEPLLRRALVLQPASEFLHFELGALLAARGDAAGSEREHLAALGVNPRFAPAWLARAEAAARAGRPGDEERILGEAVATGTASAAIRIRRAQIALGAGRLDEAESEALAALHLLPEWAAGWLVAGEVAERRGDRPAARERYGRAERLGGPPGDQARRHLARLPATRKP